MSQTALFFISQPCTKINLKNKNCVELIKATVYCSDLCSYRSVTVILYVRSVHKAHTNMNVNRGAGFLYLFIKQNTSTEIKLLMLLFVDY